MSHDLNARKLSLNRMEGSIKQDDSVVVQRVISVLVLAEHSALPERTCRLPELLTSKHYKHCLKFSESAVNNAGEDVPRENMFADAFSLAQLFNCTPFS